MINEMHIMNFAKYRNCLAPFAHCTKTVLLRHFLTFNYNV